MASWKRFFHRSARGSRALGLGITLALAGFAMVAPGGCTLDRQGLATAAGGAPSTTTTVTTSTSTSADTSTSAGSCTTGGGCTPCTMDAECPAPSADGCAVFTCVGQVCTPKDTTGMLSKIQTPNDCKKNVCGADGKSASQADSFDLPADDGNACTDQVCVGDKPMLMPVAVGTACNNGKCDDVGNCLNCMKDGDCTMGTTPTCDLTVHTCISCSDNIQNGTETTPDCGGVCKNCDGNPCANKGECQSAQCFDGVCCNAACGGTCQACDLPATVGVCTPVPAGHQDPSSCDKATDACNGAGVCKKAAGAPCTMDTDCGSGSCFAQICRIEAGGDCANDLTCASGHCLNLKCANCSTNAECASMSCAAPTCKAPPGAGCEVDADCSAGTCQFKLCLIVNGGACNLNADCVSGVCKAGVCSPCTVSDPCTPGASCGMTYFGMTGTCNRPNGAYCYIKNQCEGLKPCTGFPPVCQ